MDAKNKQLAYAIVEYLQSASKSFSDEDKESLEVATQCIQEVFKVDVNDPSQQGQYSIKPASLMSIFEVFLKTQQKKAAPKTEVKTVTPEMKKKAEDLKTQGNKKVSEKSYAEAVKLYTEAIELNPDNAVYYANRAAAYSQMGEHDNAINDAKKSSEIDPSYSKAYSRLGHAYYSMGNYPEAIAAYTKGLELDPNNQAMKATLTQAKNRLSSSSPIVEEPQDEVPSSKTKSKKNQGSTSRSTPAGGMPGMGGAGGMPDLAGLLNNPALMGMAQQMMSNPQFAQMAQGLMGGLGGAGGAGGAGGLASMLNNPQVANMARQAMSDPSIMNMMNNLGGAGGPAAGNTNNEEES